MKALLSGTPCDAHTWNLIYLELLLQEGGAQVMNLGPSFPVEQMIQKICTHQPDLVVLSCVNGGLFQEGLAFMEEIQAANLGATTSYVIGGLVDASHTPFLTKKLLQKGFSGVFLGPDSVPDFVSFLGRFNTHGTCLAV